MNKLVGSLCGSAAVLSILAACSVSSTINNGGDPDGGAANGADGGPSGSGGGDIGFRAAKNGFKFQNYTNEGVQNLSPAEMRRMCGDAVCANKGAECTLTPAAQKGLKDLNDMMNGGHCEGMAVLSLLMYAKKANVSDFGADDILKLDLSSNAKLQREIAYWWSTQIPLMSKKQVDYTMTPKGVMDRLAQAFTAGVDKESFTIAFQKRDKTGGHAVTPYAVDMGDGHKGKILIYDNNFPAEERSIEVDRDADTWKYTAAANPNDTASLYEGDATTKTLGIAPTSARLGQFDCGIAADVPATPTAAPTAPRQLQSGGEGNVVVKDDKGNQAGVVDGQFVNTIPGASAQASTSGAPEYWNSKRAPFFSLPADGPLTVTLDGSTLKSAQKSGVTMTGAGWVLAVEDVNLDPTQKDTLKFSADNTEISYTTTGEETPTLVLGVQQDGADYLFSIRAHGAASGVNVDLKMNLADGKLRMAFGGMAGAGYDIEVHRLDDTGDAAFTHAGNTGSDGDVLYLDYKAWAGNGTPMTVEVDKGGDGSVDSSTPLGDEG